MKKNEGVGLFALVATALIIVVTILMQYLNLDALVQAADLKLSDIGKLCDEREPYALQLGSGLVKQDGSQASLEEDIKLSVKKWKEAKSRQEKINADLLISKNMGRVKTEGEKYESINISHAYTEMFGKEGIEAAFLVARKDYNNIINMYNTGLKSFPSNIAAWIFRMEPLQQYS